MSIRTLALHFEAFAEFEHAKTPKRGKSIKNHLLNVYSVKTNLC